MKSTQLLPLAATFSLVSCAQIASTLQEPISSDYNPLDGPNAPRLRSNSFQPTGPTYQPGEWVETAMPNATFYKRIPRGGASADQILSLGSPLKVISTKGSHLKVELEGGTVGYIPTIMVAEPRTSTDNTPFLPPPPSEPLQRSSNNYAPPSIPTDVTTAPLDTGGSSLIPPPSNVTETAPVTIPSTIAAPPAEPERKPTEILIPTTPKIDLPILPTAPSSGGSIPAPSSVPGAIDQSIGIE